MRQVLALAVGTVAFSASGVLAVDVRGNISLDRKAITPPAAPLTELVDGTDIGFEVPYTVGNLTGQQGWGVSTNSSTSTAFQVSTSNVIEGAQSLLVSDNTAIANGTLSFAFSPTTTRPPNTPGTVSVDFQANGVDFGTNYLIYTQAPSQLLATSRFIFQFDGAILVVDESTVTPGTLVVVDTNLTWSSDQVYNYTAKLDPVAETVEHYLDGALIYTAVMWGGSSIEHILLGHDNFENPGETASFDNVTYNIPEPTLLGTLAGAALLAARRRRA